MTVGRLHLGEGVLRLAVHRDDEAVFRNWAVRQVDRSDPAASNNVLLSIFIRARRRAIVMIVNHETVLAALRIDAAHGPTSLAERHRSAVIDRAEICPAVSGKPHSTAPKVRRADDRAVQLQKAKNLAVRCKVGRIDRRVGPCHIRHRTDRSASRHSPLGEHRHGAIAGGIGLQHPSCQAAASVEPLERRELQTGRRRLLGNDLIFLLHIDEDARRIRQRLDFVRCRRCKIDDDLDALRHSRYAHALDHAARNLRLCGLTACACKEKHDPLSVVFRMDFVGGQRRQVEDDALTLIVRAKAHARQSLRRLLLHLHTSLRLRQCRKRNGIRPQGHRQSQSQTQRRLPHTLAIPSKSI